MSRTRRRASKVSTDKSATTDIVTQLQVAFRRPEAALIGALVGGLRDCREQRAAEHDAEHHERDGSAIALARDATCRRQEADARRAATRAKRSARAVKTPAIPFVDETAAPKARTSKPAGRKVSVVSTEVIDDAEIVSSVRYLA